MDVGARLGDRVVGGCRAGTWRVLGVVWFPGGPVVSVSVACLNLLAFWLASLLAACSALLALPLAARGGHWGGSPGKPGVRQWRQ